MVKKIVKIVENIGLITMTILAAGWLTLFALANIPKK